MRRAFTYTDNGQGQNVPQSCIFLKKLYHKVEDDARGGEKTMFFVEKFPKHLALSRKMMYNME